MHQSHFFSNIENMSFNVTREKIPAKMAEFTAFVLDITVVELINTLYE